MTTFAYCCATTSVAVGLIFMVAAGAPRFYILSNAIALILSMIFSWFLRRLVVNRFLGGALTLSIASLLLATALAGPHIDGVSRWIRVAGISLQPSLILLPAATIVFARYRDWLTSVGLVVAASAIGLQPDRAMSATLLAALATLWWLHREPTVLISLSAALVGLIAATSQSDPLPAAPFVEHVVQSAFAFHWWTGFAVVAGLATALLPSLRVRFHTAEQAAFAVFGVTWLGTIVASVIGNYPTPLVGYGSSAILGYCLSVAMLPPSPA